LSGTAENPFVDQTQPPGRQETGVTERITVEQARERMGLLADALVMDQQAGSTER